MMLDINDFSKKQIVVFMPSAGDKISYRNDNMIISDKHGKIKYQYSCYRIFLLMVIGDTTLTTGIIRRAKKYAFSICFFTYGFRPYCIIEAGMQGNTYLRKKQYAFSSIGLGQRIIYNKILNQKYALERIRRKTPEIHEGIEILGEYLDKVIDKSINRETLLGYEGNASRVYFARIFNNCKWVSRKPRIKFDYLNCLLDIGYSLLFNFIDAILQVFGFDTYQGILHTCFYMRKSLVCDIMEPFRPIIDIRVRKGINLKQFKEDDFVKIQEQWVLEYNKSTLYTSIFMQDILSNKEAIFLYIRAYYRAFMKERAPEQFPLFLLSDDSVKVPSQEDEDDFSEL